MPSSVLPTTEEVQDVELAVPINELFKSNDIIAVYVGDAQEHWVLNRHFLFHKIPSLKQKLEANPKHDVKLAQVEPPVFAMALDWMFTGKLLCKKPHSPGQTSDHFAILCALHVFAEKFEITRLSIATIERIKNCMTNIPWKPTSMEIRYIFNETPSRSALRTIVVGETASAFARQSIAAFEEHAEEWCDHLNCHQEFHARILLAIKRLGHARDPQAQGGRSPVPLRRQGALFNEIIDLTAGED